MAIEKQWYDLAGDRIEHSLPSYNYDAKAVIAEDIAQLVKAAHELEQIRNPKPESSTMLYDEDSNRYFDDEDDAYGYYWDNELTPPEFLYGTKKADISYVSPSRMQGVIETIIESFDDVPEFSTEDNAFGEMITEEDEQILRDLLSAWLQRAVKTCEQDKTVKYPTAEEYAKYVAEQGE